MKKSRRILAALAFAGASALASASSAETWNLPTAYPAQSFHTQNLEMLAREVEEATGGELAIAIHPAGSLVKHPEIKNAVRSRQVQMGEFLLSRLSNEDPIFEADAVPFLAASYEAARRLWDAQRPHVEAALARQNITVLYAAPWPPNGLYTTRPITEIGDFAGMRFRTYNAATERFAELIGAVPTQIEVPDVPQAFATGRVDSMITSATTGANARAWDFLSHYYDARAFLPKNIVVVNTAALEALPEAHRAALLGAAARAEIRGWAMSEAETSEQNRALAENGVIVEAPSEALSTSLKAIGARMIEEWSAKSGSGGAAILEGVAF